MSIKILFGLGNSEAVYAATRHNVGALLLKSVADKCGAEFSHNKFCNAQIAKVRFGASAVVLAFCCGYMNNSGIGVGRVLSFYKMASSEAAVIYDDISLELGRVKITLGGSSGGHNGVNDIIGRVGNDFVRLRMGVGSKPFKEMDLADHVLGKMTAYEMEKIASFDICGCVETLVLGGLARAQNVYNRAEADRG